MLSSEKLKADQERTAAESKLRDEARIANRIVSNQRKRDAMETARNSKRSVDTRTPVEQVQDQIDELFLQEA